MRLKRLAASPKVRIVVEVAIDGFLDEGKGDGLGGDDDEGLGVVGGALLKLGQEGILHQFDGNGSDAAGPGVLEGLSEALPPSVVLVDEADVVEAKVSVDLSQSGPLGAVGEGGAEEEAVVLDGGEEGRSGGGADGGDPPGAGDLPGDGEGGGAGVGADDGVDAGGVDEK